MQSRSKEKAAPAHSTSSSALLEAEQRQQEQVGVRMKMEMIVREDVILPFGEGDGQTLGQVLDRHLVDLAKHGGEPSSFTFSFDPKSWEQAKPLYEGIQPESFFISAIPYRY
jgi:hypothetical protein